MKLTLLSAQVPDDSHFKVEALVDAMEITVLPTQDVFIVERTGALKWYSPASGETNNSPKWSTPSSP